jgi:putative ABC transport system substrate-binding protein
LTLVGGAAVAWPGAAHAQAERMRRVGIALAQDDDPVTQVYLAAFQQRMAVLGWIEDRTIRFEPRWAGGDTQRMRAIATELAGLGTNVILAQNTPMVAALHKQTDSIPIVFVQVSDPVGDGFVKALANPGGNVTGFTNTMSSLGGKWLELLREVSPGISRAGFLFNRETSPGGGAYYMQPLQSAAAAFGLKAVPVELRGESEIDSVIDSFAAAGPGGGLVADSDAFVFVHRDRITAAANRNRLPAIYSASPEAEASGLLSYGTKQVLQWEAAAGYVDRILRGEQPRDLAVQQPATFELVVNLKTAKAIGLTIPESFLLRADRVIE